MRRAVMGGAKVERNVFEAFLEMLVKVVEFSKAVQRLCERVLLTPGASLMTRMGYGYVSPPVALGSAAFAWWKPCVKFSADSPTRASPEERKKGVESLVKF